MNSLQTVSKRTVQSCPGAADQELFIKEFEEIPRRQFVLLNSVEDNIQTVKFNLENVNLDWQKRIEAMQTFRSILIDLTDVNLIVNSLKELENSFQLSLKDLRSKIVREACITIAYTSVRLQNKCEKFIETLLPLLFNLTQNSTKIMSTSACVAIRFIIQNTHSGKFILILNQNLCSKSKEIRRYCCDFLNQLLRTWSKPILEKHTLIIIESIKKGLNDADPDARSFSRKAFWMFDYHFKDKANQLIQTLDQNKRRLLNNEKTADINCNSVECLDNVKMNVKSRLAIAKPRFTKPPKNPALASVQTPVRSTSSIDIDAIKRAKIRNDDIHVFLTPGQYSVKCNSNSSIKENLNIESNIHTPAQQQSQQQIEPQKKISTSSIPRNKFLNVSIASRNSIGNSPLNRSTRSQPGSRSASPSLRSNYLNDLASPFGSDVSSCSNGKSKRSAIPVITTRQPTQEDYTNSPLMSRSFIRRDSSHSTKKLQISTIDYQSDQSEVSSLCSDKSFGDRKLEDINDIIKNLNSTNWPNKKDGLFSLEHFIYHSPVELNDEQLKLLTDLFTKMLLDPNTKALSHLLNVLNIFIIHYHEKLTFWLYILLTRLFLKTGSDLLVSIQKRMFKTFETIADSFSKSLQFNVLIQFISDNKLTPALKVKITTLQYLNNLIRQMDPSDLNCSKNKNEKEFEQFITKIITWTEEKKSAQLRSLSQGIILGLFNLNTPVFCNIVSQLPTEHWKTATKYMKEKQVSTQHAEVDDSIVFSQSFYDQMLKNSFNRNEDINQTAIFDSLMKTTEEINRYTSILNDNDLDEHLSAHPKQTHPNDYSVHTTTTTNTVDYEDDDQSTYKTSEIDINDKKGNSMDSGISQIDCASTTYKTSTSTNRSPESRSENVDNSSGSDLTTYNSFKSMNSFYVTTTTSMKNDSNVEENLINTNNEINNNNYIDEVVKFDGKKFEFLVQQIENRKLDLNERLKSLEEFDTCILTSDHRNAIRPFIDTDLIKMFVCQFDDKELILRQLAIKTFSDLLNEFASDCMTQKQLELILDRLLFLSKQDSKDLNAAIQYCTDAIATNFPIKNCVDYLIRIIDNGQYPSNEASIKLITKFIKHSDEETINKLMPKIIPSIVRSNDNAITSVRKFSIFCLVELFNKVGMVIKPYLSSLDSSKIKLLKIYIDDSKTTRSSSPLLKNKLFSSILNHKSSFSSLINPNSSSNTHYLKNFFFFRNLT